MIIKELDDYLDKVCEKHSRIKRKDIKRILEYGFRMFDGIIRNGGDIYIRDHRFWASVERYSFDNLSECKYISRKQRIKLRNKYKLHHEKFDGIYYVGIPDAEFELLKKKITKEKKVTLNNVRFFKIKEEAYSWTLNDHFLKIYYPIDRGFEFFKDSITIDHYKYIACRNGKKINEFYGECDRTD